MYIYIYIYMYIYIYIHVYLYISIFLTQGPHEEVVDGDVQPVHVVPACAKHMNK